MALRKRRPPVRHGIGLGLLLLLAACQGNQESPPPGDDTAHEQRPDAGRYDEFEIITVLPRDAIPAIVAPEFLPAAEASAVYAPDELVLGVEFNGDARAYSVPYLSGHEIVNDEVGGVKIAVTW